MTVKDLIITLFFIGSVVLAVWGGWNYMWGRINLYRETVKIDQMAAAGRPYYNAEEELKKIRKEKTNALIMFAGGFTGIFLVIRRVYRQRRHPIYPKYKTRQT